MTQQINKRLIAFTGPDGIGKTTQAKLLVDWINSEADKGPYYNNDEYINLYYNAEYIKELSDSDYIFEAFRNLVISLYPLVDTVTLANVIKLNRYVLQDQINTQLNEYYDDIIVVDRWNICTYVYLKAKGVSEEIAASYLTDEHTIIPGLTIMLVGMNGATRTFNRPDNNNMFEDIGSEFKIRLAEAYLDFDTNLYAGKVVKINNDDLTKEQTHELIKQAVLDYFKGEL
jgi:thymidylate kinase